MSDNTNGLNMFVECESLLEELSPTDESTIAGGSYGGYHYYPWYGFHRKRGRKRGRKHGRKHGHKYGYGY